MRLNVKLSSWNPWNMKLTWTKYVWDGRGPHRPAWAGVRAQWARAGVWVLVVDCLVEIRISYVLTTRALGAARPGSWVAVRCWIRILIWIWARTCVDVGTLIYVWARIRPGGAGTGETVLISVSVLIKIWIGSLIIIWWCLIVIGVLTLVTIRSRVTVCVALRARVVVGSRIIVWARLLIGSALIWPPCLILLCSSRTGPWVGVWSLTSVSWQILRRRNGRSGCRLRCWWCWWVVRGWGRCWGARGTRACALSRARGGRRGGHHRGLRWLRRAGYGGLRGRSCNAKTSFSSDVTWQLTARGLFWICYTMTAKLAPSETNKR